MTAKKKTPAKPAADRPDVTIYPTGEAWIPDVEPIEQTVSAERADELLAYSPAAFTTKRPKATGGKVIGAALVLVGESGPEVAETASTETPPADDAGATPQEA